MIGFYKKNISYLSETAVNPDRRRYAVPDEAPRHFIDLDKYGDSAAYRLPRNWNEAVLKFGQDSLEAHGIVPWHIQRMYWQLKQAFLVRDPQKDPSSVAETGSLCGRRQRAAPHHQQLRWTTDRANRNSCLLGIALAGVCILPNTTFWLGKAAYLRNVQLAAWEAVANAHQATILFCI